MGVGEEWGGGGTKRGWRLLVCERSTHFSNASVTDITMIWVGLETRGEGRRNGQEVGNDRIMHRRDDNQRD